MEQTEAIINSAFKKQIPAADGSPPLLLSPQLELITEDLATFLIAHYILITGNDSISAVKKYFERAPEILEIVDELLAQLEKHDFISVAGDHITVNKRFFDIGGSVENLRKFLPRLFKLSADRVLSDAVSGAHKGKREGIRFFAMPDDPKTTTEAQALYLEYKAKMINLVERATKESRKSDNVRLVGVFNCSLVPEDFA